MRKSLNTLGKLQLAEAGFANAIPEMVKSAQEIGLIDKGLKLTEATQAFFKLQQDGKVITEKILPTFSKRMKEFAAAGLAKKLESNTTAMGKFFNIIESSSNVFFKSGFSEGLTDFFNSTAKMIKDNEILWKSLGKVIGGVLKGLAFLMNSVVKPVLSAIGSILNTLTALFGDFTAAVLTPLAAVSPVLGFILKRLGGIKGALKGIITVARSVVLPFVVILGVLEEIAEFFNPTGKKMLITTNIDKISTQLSKLKEDISISGVVGAIGSRTNAAGAAQNQALMSYLNRDSGGSAVKAHPVTVGVTLEVDKEVIAEKVIETEAARSGMDRQLSSYVTGNY